LPGEFAKFTIKATRKMNKNITLLFLLLFGSQLFGQIRKGSIVLDATFDYNTKTNPAKLLSEESYKQSELNLAISYFLNSNYFVGTGFNLKKKNTDNYITFSNIGGQDIIVPLNIVEKSNEALVYVGYWKNITPKFSWSSIVDIGIGFDKTTPTSNGLDLNNIQRSTHLALQLKSSLNYLISDSFGLKLAFGGIKFQTSKVSAGYTDFKFNLNLNPNNWQFGLLYIMPSIN
jgi:hypothetical protein